VILPISIFSSISYIAKGVIEWRTTRFVAAGVIVGGIVGAVFLKKISNKALIYVFAVIMIAVGAKMFLS
ncbi:MAG: TSUP family transporter, partial [Clostridia bacterium]